jgi:hypothetical protein
MSTRVNIPLIPPAGSESGDQDTSTNDGPGCLGMLLLLFVKLGLLCLIVAVFGKTSEMRDRDKRARESERRQHAALIASLPSPMTQDHPVLRTNQSPQIPEVRTTWPRKPDTKWKGIKDEPLKGSAKEFWDFNNNLVNQLDEKRRKEEKLYLQPLHINEHIVKPQTPEH